MSLKISTHIIHKTCRFDVWFLLKIEYLFRYKIHVGIVSKNKQYNISFVFTFLKYIKKHTIIYHTQLKLKIKIGNYVL